MYKPKLGGHRHVIKLSKSKSSGEIASALLVKKLDPPGAVIDTSTKEYLQKDVCGFTVNYEGNVFECTKGLEDAIIEDLNQICTLVPSKGKLTLVTN